MFEPTDRIEVSTKQRLKSWSHFYEAIIAGQKLHDLRFKGDRTFHVGEVITLCEYDNIRGRYTGRECDAEITYITDDVVPCAFSSAVLDKDYCILSIKVMSPNDET